MDEMVIQGGRPLRGGLVASGAKNAALPIMAATILTEGTSVLRRVPRLADVETMIGILRALGVEVDRTGPDGLRLHSRRDGVTVAPFELVRRMRGSICVLGPLLATRGAAVLAMPGGCVLGERPIDLHVLGLSALGATVQTDDVCVYGTARGLTGADMRLAGPRGSTVLGTANVLMAATLARGRTVIRSAACEPEVRDLACFLVACGARIRGIGTRTLTIDGVPRLHGAEHSLLPDRIEAGTLLSAGAITGGDVTVERCLPEDLEPALQVMRRMGVEITTWGDAVRARRAGPLRAVRFATAPHPGVATDMQPQLSALLCLADGDSFVTDRVYPDRFTHMPGLCQMGARILRAGATIVIQGVPGLHGEPVHAADLRAGAALTLAGLAAEETTSMTGVDQIDRGYQDLEQVLAGLGADVVRRPSSASEPARRIPA